MSATPVFLVPEQWDFIVGFFEDVRYLFLGVVVACVLLVFSAGVMLWK